MGCKSTQNKSKTSFKSEVFACYYHDKFNGRKTASGAKFSNHKLTAAHKTLECGLYNPKKPNLKVHPYYIRSTILIKSSEWKILKEKFFALKKEYDLPINKEIKWAYLWSLRIHQKIKHQLKTIKILNF
ncbi:septal ring lytic transglycosylase RlpA family protein [Myroides ceti]|uniref:Septal ring lytic transglycosylase RlpA family protein n=1 Tax=Paenimyroides ceti TaxID=395087 RepID=A0ABT8D2N1_9FLAO|nr:septal ring lytic transglycosylase RlpA family protein [Paenimyroides ceti]MDN3709735.1 septal ring lytic transglycosylase RlpA family protein [Paenimyroides ceti]